MTDLELYSSVLKELHELYKKKNEDYSSDGKSTAEQMFELDGEHYFSTMLLQKALRIHSVVKSGSNNFESLQDSYKDIANYAIMALMYDKKLREQQ